MEFEYQEKYKYLSNICLNLTDSCNLACKYCFVEQHPHFMTYETAQQAVDYIINNLHYKKEIGYVSQQAKATLTFFGGEPMLCYDTIIQPLIAYIEQTYPNEINLDMTTNGTLLTEERIDYLKQHNVGILLSMDGAKQTQDYNRPSRDNNSSFDKIIPILPKLLKEYPRTTFRSTIYADTVEHTFENFVFASYLGFKNIFTIPDSRHPWTEQQKEILHQELKKIFAFIRNAFQKNITPISFSLINVALEDILTHDIDVINNTLSYDAIQRNVMRCGLGTSTGSIGYDGKIYGCQEQDSKNQNSKFYIGDLKTGIDIDKHSKLLAEYNQLEKVTCEKKELCVDCKLQAICHNQPCPSTSQDLFNSFFIDSEIHCLWKKWIFDESIDLLHFLVSENNQCFNHYLQNYCNYKKYFTHEEENSNGSTRR